MCGQIRDNVLLELFRSFGPEYRVLLSWASQIGFE
jgi:hypothetical protein